MRSQQFGRILQQVGGMLSGSGQGARTRGDRTRRTRGHGSPRTRRGTSSGGGLSRMVNRFLR